MLKGYLYAFQKALERATHAGKEAGQIISGFLDDDTPLRMAQISRAAQAMRDINDNLSAIEEIEEIFDKVQGEVLNRLTQENASLKEQLIELSQRERAYLSIIARTTTPYSVPSQEDYSLFASYQTEHGILKSNLHYLREQAARYGPLDTPLHIRNNIEAHEKRINEIDAYIANYEAHFKKASKPESGWM